MKTVFGVSSGVIFLAFAVLVTGCGGAQSTRKLSPADLLAKGEYKKARQSALNADTNKPENRAITALSYLAETPEKKTAATAVKELGRETNEIGSAVAALEMLAFVNILPPIDADDFSLLLAEVGAGAAGHGTLKVTQSGPEPGSEISTALSIAVLEQLQIYVSATDGLIESGRLLEVWNGCYSLLGGSMGMEDPVQAWRLYSAIAGVSVALAQVAPQTDLVKVLLQSTVTTVEQNTEIAVAVRCDLSSPFEDLRTELVHHRSLLGRFESAVAVATGCSMGTYAPTSSEK